MEALKSVAALIMAAILMVAVYVSGALLGWFFLALSILAIIGTVLCFIAYAIYEGIGHVFKSRKANKDK